MKISKNEYAILLEKQTRLDCIKTYIETETYPNTKAIYKLATTTMEQILDELKLSPECGVDVTYAED